MILKNVNNSNVNGGYPVFSTLFIRGKIVEKFLVKKL
jgi:hypothetical protein